MSRDLHRVEGTQIFRGFISSELQQFHSSREKYVAAEAARSVIRGLVNDENIPNHQQTESIDDAKFKNTSQALVNEIFELQCEMSKKDFLQEKMKLFGKEKDIAPPQPCSNSVLSLQAEIEQAEILLQGLKRKNDTIETQLIDSEVAKSRAQEELDVVKQMASSPIRNSDLTSTNCEGDSMAPEQAKSRVEVAQISSHAKTKTDLERFQAQKSSLLALTAGLESLFQLRLEAVEVTPENGVLMTIAINGTHTFGFELDEKKKLVDIQHTLASGRWDPLRLLCDCAQLPPPLDLRHALLACAASLRREQALQCHLTGTVAGEREREDPFSRTPIYKLCLLQRDKTDDSKINVTFRNGIHATLKIHDCYPDVPNGVHIEELTCSSSGMEWEGREEELGAARCALNSRCLQTLPDMVRAILDFCCDENEE